MNVEAFLAMLYRFAMDGYVGVTYIAPEGVAVDGARVLTHFAPMPLQYELDLTNVHAMNARGYSVYFRVMVQSQRHDEYHRGKASESIYTGVLWSEVDFKDVSEDEALEAINSIAHKPSLIVRSGGGYHLYWLLNEVLCTNGAHYSGERGRALYVEPADLKRTLRGIAAAIGCADRKVSELARVMRLPDTINTKPERHGARCVVLSETAAATYDYRELEMTYAPLVHSEIQMLRPTLNVPSADLPAVLRDYLANGTAQGGRNDALNKAAYLYHALGKSQSEALRDLGARAAADGLSDNEIETTINSAYRAAVTPMLTLAQKRIAGRDKSLR